MRSVIHRNLVFLLLMRALLPAMSRLLFAAAVLAALLPMDTARAAPRQNARPWTGKVECRVELADASARTEIQTWTLSGAAPSAQGAMTIYPATWAASGNGSGPSGNWILDVPAQPTVISVFVRASDQRLIFRQGALPAEVKAAVSLTGGSAMAASEWNFGWIDSDASATRVSGSRESSAAPLPGGLSVANLAPPMQCQWEFSKETPTAVAPQSAMNRSTFERPADRAAPSTGNMPMAEEVPRTAEACPACAERAGEIAATYESAIASLLIAQKRDIEAIREQKRRADETAAEYDALERSLLQEQQRLLDVLSRQPDRDDDLRRALERSLLQQRLEVLRDQKRSALQIAAMYDASERSLLEEHQRLLEDLRDQKRRALHAVQQECEKIDRCKYQLTAPSNALQEAIATP